MSKSIWAERPIIDASHARSLDMRAASLEFGHGLSRQAAEAQAHGEYVKEHHSNAAAHHLAGMKAAHAVGAMDDAQRHGQLYTEHVKALGHPEIGPVPADIAAKAKLVAGLYRFKEHGADSYLKGGDE